MKTQQVKARRSSSQGEKLSLNGPKLNSTNFKNDPKLEKKTRLNRMRKRMRLLRTNVLKSNATLDIDKRKRSDGVSSAEKTTLRKKIIENEKIVEQLPEALNALIASTNKIFSAQAAAEVALSREKLSTTQHITQAVGFLEAEIREHKLRFEKKLFSLDEELLDMELLMQREVLLKSQNDERPKSAEESELIVTPSISTEVYHDLIQENEIYQFLIQNLKEEIGKLKATVGKGRMKKTISRSPKKSIDKLPKTVELQKEYQGLQLTRGKHSILVSDRKYFAINWKTKYESLGMDKACCKICRSYVAQTGHVKDHIWCVHYGGRFHCMYCVESKTFKWRENVSRHVHINHPHVFMV